MDRMEDEIDEEFTELPNATRTALAFAKQANADGALALLNRYAGRHSREWHKAVDKLRAIQKDRLQNEPNPAAPAENPEREREDHHSPNEPEPALTPTAPIGSELKPPGTTGESNVLLP